MTGVHLTLGVAVFGVGPQGVQGDHEFAGNVRATQVSSEQPQHVALAFAQHLLDRLTWLHFSSGAISGADRSLGRASRVVFFANGGVCFRTA